MKFNYFVVNFWFLSLAVRCESLNWTYNYGKFYPNKIYDYIIVGAGNSGCVLANRLSENPNVTVLLLEAGSAEIPLLTDFPLMASILQTTSFSYPYVTEPQTKACLGLVDKRCTWVHGKGIGGSSILNNVIYTRGNKKDFNAWSAAGNPGWSYDEILPYYKKIETANIRDFQDNGYHGFSGPVSVEDVPFRSKISHAMIKAANLSGYPYVDYNSDFQMGVSYLQQHSKNGWRITSGKAYLEPIAQQRKNLHILTNCKVTKVLINEKTMSAKGVEFHFDKKKFEVKAGREVILSAGSFESPKLLMLSGIGPADQLINHGIKLIKNLPVGETLYEHLGVLGPLVIIDNIDNLISMDGLLNPKTLFDWLSGKGPLTSNSVETLLYLRTNYSMFPDDDIPDIEVMQSFIDVSYDTSPGTRKAFRLTDEVYDAVYKPLEKVRAFQFLMLLLHPRSKGNMKLKSKNPYHYPLFYPNYFDDERDLDSFVAGIREVIRILQQKPFQDIGARLHEAKVPGCEGLAFNSDEYWRCYSMHMTITYHHQIGVCKMGPETDATTVVDHKLRVHGIKNLRVIDTGIIPQTPTAHTSALSFLIGEKGADFIKEEWTQ